MVPHCPHVLFSTLLSLLGAPSPSTEYILPYEGGSAFLSFGEPWTLKTDFLWHINDVEVLKLKPLST